jgi:hypothetical protein
LCAALLLPQSAALAQLALPRVELVIKQKTARALGLTVLTAVLLRAGRVIE